MTDLATTPAPLQTGTPLVEMRNINVAFGGVHAVRNVSINLYPGEVVGLVGGNGAGKSTLTKVLSGAQRPDSGQIMVNGTVVDIANPRDAKAYGIETIYQTLAPADNPDAPARFDPSQPSAQASFPQLLERYLGYARIETGATLAR